MSSFGDFISFYNNFDPKEMSEFSNEKQLTNEGFK